MGVSYEKLIRFLRENPSYEFVEREGVIEVTFHAPTLAEAAGALDVEGGHEPAVVRLVFERVGDRAFPREAWIERGDFKRLMSVEALDVWLEFIENYY